MKAILGLLLLCAPLLLRAALHWSLTEAGGINDGGVIVGTGEHEGKGRAFLLTPKGR